MTRWKLFLLGSPHLERDGETVPIGRRRTMALLAYLAMTGRTHQRDALAALLWPEWDASHARADLRRTLSLLNHTLGGSAVVADRETAALDPELDLWVDVVTFRQALSAREAHKHPTGEACEACVPGLEEAVALYRDDFLAGFTLEAGAAFDEWQFFETQALRDAAAGALARLVTWHAAQGERSTERAIAYARRWLALDPLHEPAHQQLMALYFRAGQRSAALRQYRQCLRVLEEELGAAPSAETTALYERFKTERQAHRAPAPAQAPDSQAQGSRFPSFLKATEGDDAPEPVFVTREAELARLGSYLEAALGGAGQVAFVTGGAGRGKTALLRAFVRRALAAHPELLVASGACNATSGAGDPFLPFREMLGMLTGNLEARWAARTITRDHARRLWAALPVTLPAFVAHGPHLVDAFVPGAELIARAEQARLAGEAWLAELRSLTGRTGGSALAQQALFQQATNVLQAVAAKHPLLLLIDDLQWMDQGSVGLLFHLARRLTGCRILVVAAYRPDEVSSTAVADAPSLEKVLAELKRDYGDVWLDLREADAVGGRRFVDAFLDSEPNRLGEAFREALLGRTRGHALFTVELLRTLQAHGDLIRGADGLWEASAKIDWTGLPARVEAVISARLERLDEEQRELLTVAAVEGETFTAQVVAQVLGQGERGVLSVLSRDLSRKHRLVREAGEVSVGGGFLTRHAFSHTLFQEHLYRELSVGERRLLHGEVGSALEHLYGEGRGRIAVQLAYHFDQAGHIRQAVEYGSQAGDQALLAGAGNEATRYYQRVLQQLGEVDLGDLGTSLRVRALKGLGRLCKQDGRYPESEAYLREAIALGRGLGQDPQELAFLFFWLGEALCWQGKWGEMRRAGEEGLELIGEDVESVGMALMHYTIAMALGGACSTERTRALTRRTASFLRDLPYVEELGYAYYQCMQLCQHENDIEGAHSWLEARAERARKHGDLLGLVSVTSDAAFLAQGTGDLRTAIAKRQSFLDAVTRAGNVTDRGWSLVNLAELSLYSGDLERATLCVDESLPLSEALGYREGVAYSREFEGVIAMCRGNWTAAIRAFLQAKPFWVLTHDPFGPNRMHYSVGMAYLAAGDRERARQYLTEALVDLGTTGDESDATTRKWLATCRLSGLEKACGSPDAFQAWVKDLHEAYPYLDCGLDQWSLKPAQARSVGGHQQVVEGVDPLSSSWVWMDPYGDCAYDGSSGLVIRAANGRALYSTNLSAPRLMRNLPHPASDIIVQVEVEPALGDRPCIGGLLIWADRRNYVCLELGRLGLHEVVLATWVDSQFNPAGGGRLPDGGQGESLQPWPILLRLELDGKSVKALCSSDGQQWFGVGQVTFPMHDTVQVGLFAMGDIDRTIYHGAYPEGTAIRFTSFGLWA